MVRAGWPLPANLQLEPVPLGGGGSPSTVFTKLRDHRHQRQCQPSMKFMTTLTVSRAHTTYGACAVRPCGWAKSALLTRAGSCRRSHFTLGSNQSGGSCSSGQGASRRSRARPTCPAARDPAAGHVLAVTVTAVFPSSGGSVDG